MGRGECILNPANYPGTCYSCEHYYDYGPVAGRIDKNGMCKIDKHETDALVKCTINKYKYKEYEDRD